MKKLLSFLLSLTMLLSVFSTGVIPASAVDAATDLSPHEHTYEYDCDAVCNDCKAVREVTHKLNYSGCSVCGADVGACGDSIIWFIQDDVLILTGSGEMHHYEFWGNTVPWEMYQDSVTKVVVNEGITSIGTNAFCYFINLTEVELPSTIQSFGMNAFACCDKLTELTIPKDLKSIDVSAFANCISMLEYKVAEGNTYFSVEDGVLFSADKTSIWAYPIGLTEPVYEMPDTVERVEAYAFSNATALQEIIFSENLKHIDDEGFFGCTGLTEITLPDSFQSTGGGAFQECINLNSIHLPDTMTRIGPLAFDQTAYYNNIDNWENKLVLYLDNYVLQAREKWDMIGNEEEDLELSGEYTVRDNVTLIADEAFDFLDNLTKITLPVTLQYIGEGAFCFCDSLTEIDIPSSVTHIGEIAFMGCELLGRVDLPSGLQRIGYDAFEDTPYLNSVVTAENPIGYRENYVVGAHSSLKTADIKEGITLIAERAFEKATQVTSITLPESLEYIGADAFANTYNTKNILVPTTVKYIGDYAFGFEFYYDYDLEKDAHRKIYHFSLSGYTDSVADAYAEKFGIPFNYLDGCDHEYTFEDNYPGACNVPGVRTYTCSLCGDTYTEELPAKHMYISEDTYPDICNAPGVRTYTCSVCSDAYTEEIPGVHLNVVIDPAVAPGCNTNGLTEGSHCEACGEVIVPQWPDYQLYHYVETLERIEPDCDEPGRTEGKWCRDCQKYLVEPEYIPPTEDHLIYAYNDEPASCTQTGFTGGTYCGRCLNTITPRTVTPVNNRHTILVLDKGYDPTCTTDGKTDGAHCEACGRITKPQGTIPAGHTWQYTVEKVAGENEAGYKLRRCVQGCGTTERIELSPFNSVRATVTANGINLTWNAYPGNYIHYCIYRTETTAGSAGNKQYIAMTSHTSFFDEYTNEGSSYEYTIDVRDEYDYLIASATVKDRKNETPIKITTQPVTTTVKSGATAKVQVVATGDGLTYQWYIKNAGAYAFTKTSVTSSTYSVTMGSTTKDRAVYCVITDKYGKTAQTNTVYLRMSCSHSYSNACDTTCNNCEAKRTIKHTYTNSCDTSCNVCKATRSITHTYKTTTTKATLKKNGSVVKKCTVCGNVASKSTIKYAKSFKLSATTYSYDGKAKTPSVVVKDSAGKTLKKNTDYTVSYAKGRKNVGTYKVTIKMKGKYSGTKTLTFKINPAKTTVSKLTAGKKSITVAIAKKSAQVTGYQIQYSTSKKFTKAKTKTVSSYKTTKHTLKSLSAKKTYYVRVRTYKTVNGTKYYSGWSSYKSVKTK